MRRNAAGSAADVATRGRQLLIKRRPLTIGQQLKQQRDELLVDEPQVLLSPSGPVGPQPMPWTEWGRRGCGCSGSACVTSASLPLGGVHRRASDWPSCSTYHGAGDDVGRSYTSL